MRCVFKIIVCFYSCLHLNQAHKNDFKKKSVLTLTYHDAKINFNQTHLSEFLECLCNYETCTLETWPFPTYDTLVKTVTGHVKTAKDKSIFRCAVKRYGNDGQNILNITCNQQQNICTDKITITNSSLLGNNSCFYQCFEIGWEDSANTQFYSFKPDILTISNCTSDCKYSSNSKKTALLNVNIPKTVIVIIVIFTFIIILLAIFTAVVIIRHRRNVNTFVSAVNHFKTQDISNGSDTFIASQYCLAIKLDETDSGKTLNETQPRYCENSPKLVGDFNIMPYNFSPTIRQPESTTPIGSCNTKKPSQQLYLTEKDKLNTEDPEESNINQNFTDAYDPKIYYYLEKTDNQ
ncbi:unnamed protein product [Lymnaea stagnalis]|uniref:Uncharacterized protein n=1 Tax=Lymnaea stagnalis TaxID=6523 RepID=A0AAV2H7V7_LYMST